jgi:hypothetical protein
MKESSLLRRVVLLLLGLVVCSRIALPQSPPAPRHGLAREELLRFARSLPALPGRVQAIQFLRDSDGNFPGFVGLLTQSAQGGWQVFVLRFDGADHFALDWKSGKLDDSFEVSSPDALKTVDLGNEWVITFEGCAAHACPDVFSALLYAPSSHLAFTTNYLRGKITRSGRLEEPTNRIYKNILDDVVERRRAISPAGGR